MRFLCTEMVSFGSKVRPINFGYVAMCSVVQCCLF